MWMAPYQRIIAIADEAGKYVDLIEESPTIGGSAWITYHIGKTSPLVVKARREGSRNIFRLRAGRESVKLVPGICGAGIEEVEVLNNEIAISYCGLGGGGVGVASRGTAEGVERVEVEGKVGGSNLTKTKIVLPRLERVIVGIDDTDDEEEGATWALAHNIAVELQEKSLGNYLSHSVVQLYPKAPFKTQNCVSVALEFASNRGTELIKKSRRLLGKHTLSENTGMAVLNKFEINEEIKNYGSLAKRRIVDFKELKDVSENNEIKLYPITGERGLIGATAAIAFYNSPDEGVRL